ncbi:MAG: endonuclease/exonuclease/phosphatase family protein, partial [Stackebrandtia sp.]
MTSEPAEAGAIAADVPPTDEPGEQSGVAARVKAWSRRGMRLLGWVAAAAWGAFALVRVFGLEQGWAMTAGVAFTPYVALAAVAPIVVLAAARHWRALWAVAACAVVLAGLAAPRAIAGGQPEADGPTLQVMSANLYVGQADLARVVSMVAEHDVDLLSLQEVTPGTAERLTELGLDELLPYNVIEAEEAAAGAAIYSRHPLRRTTELEPQGVFSQPAAEVDVASGPSVEFMAVHPAAPYASHRIPLWEKDLESLPPADAESLRILAGDFN